MRPASYIRVGLAAAIVAVAPSSGRTCSCLLVREEYISIQSVTVDGLFLGDLSGYGSGRAVVRPEYFALSFTVFDTAGQPTFTSWYETAP